MDLLSYLPQIVLFGSVLYFYLAVLALILIFFIADVKEAGFHAAIAFSIFLFVTFKWGTFNFFEYFTWGMIGIYLGIGFIYALVRTYFYGRKSLDVRVYSGADDKEEATKTATEEAIKDRKEHLKGNVFRWWFLWTISLIDWILTDLVRDAYNWLYKRFRALFESILDHGIKDADINVR